MHHHVVSMNEWLFRDSAIPKRATTSARLASARGARAAFQVLVDGVKPGATLTVAFTPETGGVPTPELYRLVDVNVEANTGPIGFIVRPDRGEKAGTYVTRKAPFRVYDAMEPIGPEATVRAETEIVYASWRVPTTTTPGTYRGALRISAGRESVHVPVELDVVPAIVPEHGRFRLTNWFSVGVMAKRHNLTDWSPEHWDMIRRYAALMRRGRQTDFLLPMGLVGVKERPKGTYSFDFARVERLIRMFLDLGFTHINGGHVATRVRYEAPEFVLSAKHDVNPISREGYAFLAQYLDAWRAFLVTHGWLDRTIQHVGDEPTEQAAKDYRVIAGMVRKHLPGVPIVDAVELPDLAGAVDIWVPKNDYFENHREDFEAYRRLGDTVWCYTCCFPGGRYMNRLLDMPLIRPRQIGWGCFLYGIPGFLHWGLNHYREFQNPFEMSCPDHGGGNNLPPGDTHIVYPGPDGPWGSLRLEAQAAGIEDYELLSQVADVDRAKADAIVSETVRGFRDSDENPAHFANTHRKLLDAASALG